MKRNELYLRIALIVNNKLYSENVISYSVFSSVQDELLGKINNA